MSGEYSGSEAERRVVPASPTGAQVDVVVRWPDGTIGRPEMVAIQDVHSGKFLSWRISSRADA
jgi:hypothetical protein